MCSPRPGLPSGFVFLPLSFMLTCYLRVFLEHPRNRDPLGIFGNCLQCSFYIAVCLIKVLIDDAEVKIVTIGRLDFVALITRPL